MGLRHRAALGVTEVSDAVAVVVSEETGSISVAHNGRMIQRLDAARLRHILAAFYRPRGGGGVLNAAAPHLRAPGRRGTSSRGLWETDRPWLRRVWETLAHFVLALILAILVWVVALNEENPIEDTDVHPAGSPLPAQHAGNMIFIAPVTTEAKVKILRAPRQVRQNLTEQQISVAADLGQRGPAPSPSRSRPRSRPK